MNKNTTDERGIDRSDCSVGHISAVWMIALMAAHGVGMGLVAMVVVMLIPSSSTLGASSALFGEGAHIVFSITAGSNIL